MPNVDKYHISNRKMSQCFVGLAGSNKFMFINIPKNASTSIRQCLKNRQLVEYAPIKDKNSYVKFCIIRNPVDRVISSYSEVLKLRPDGPFYLTKQMNFFKQRNNPINSFNLFIDEISKDFYDEHTFPQEIFLKHKGLTLSDIDVTILFENIKTEIPKFFNKYGAVVSLPHAWAGKIDLKNKLMNYIKENKTIQNKITNLYREDHKLYTQLLIA